MIEYPETELEVTYWALEFSDLTQSFFIYTCVLVKQSHNLQITFTESRGYMRQHKEQFFDWVKGMLENFPNKIKIEVNHWGYFLVYLAGVLVISGVRPHDRLHEPIVEFLSERPGST